MVGKHILAKCFLTLFITIFLSCESGSESETGTNPAEPGNEDPQLETDSGTDGETITDTDIPVDSFQIRLDTLVLGGEPSDLEVQLFKLDRDGMPGSQLASSALDANGIANLPLNENALAISIVPKGAGLSEKKPVARLIVPSVKKDQKLPVNLFTELAAKRYERLIQDSNTVDAINRSLVESAAFTGTGQNLSVPSENESGDPAKLKLVLLALFKKMGDIGASRSEFIDALTKDYLDGDINGRDQASNPIEIGSTGKTLVEVSDFAKEFKDLMKDVVKSESDLNIDFKNLPRINTGYQSTVQYLSSLDDYSPPAPIPYKHFIEARPVNPSFDGIYTDDTACLGPFEMVRTDERGGDIATGPEIVVTLGLLSSSGFTGPTFYSASDCNGGSQLSPADVTIAENTAKSEQFYMRPNSYHYTVEVRGQTWGFPFNEVDLRGFPLKPRIEYMGQQYLAANALSVYFPSGGTFENPDNYIGRNDDEAIARDTCVPVAFRLQRTAFGGDTSPAIFPSTVYIHDLENNIPNKQGDPIEFYKDSGCTQIPNDDSGSLATLPKPGDFILNHGTSTLVVYIRIPSGYSRSFISSPKSFCLGTDGASLGSNQCYLLVKNADRSDQVLLRGLTDLYIAQ